MMYNNVQVFSMNNSNGAFNGEEFPENSYSTDHNAAAYRFTQNDRYILFIHGLGHLKYIV